MSARTKARKRALDLLYSADVRGQSLTEALEAETARAAREPARAASWAYASTIVRGVIEHADEIDETIRTYALDWPLERMPAVDRALLRIGVWELLHNPEVPAPAAIAEAVESAATHSTADSARFINGVLARIGDARA